MEDIFLKVQKDIAENKCSVMIDLDETIFNPLTKWQEAISKKMNNSFTVRNIEEAGGVDNYFVSFDNYEQFKQIAEELRASEELYKDSPLIDGAFDGVSNLTQIPTLKLSAYLTARPMEVLNVTKNELMKNGFPDLPILLRDRTVNFYSSVEWKVKVLKTLLKAGNGYIINIDDNPKLAEELIKLECNDKKNLITILFDGPLSHSYIKNNNLKSIKEHNFFIADWNDIPKICNQYV